MVVPFPITPPIPGGEVDFHNHTSVSDGHYTASQVVELLRMSGMGVAAITDHDDTAAIRDPVLWSTLDRLGKDAPQIVPGVEISCALKAPLVEGGEQEVHIIGLGVDANAPALRKALIRQRLGVDARIEDCVQRLRAAGYALTRAEVALEVSHERMITRADLARLLVKRGTFESFREALKTVLSHSAGYRALPERFTMDAEDAIRLIHEAGGVAILAHPQRIVINHDAEILRGLFTDLCAKGLDGVECYRQDLSRDRSPAYRAIAEEVGLLPSGGSDFHHFNQLGAGRYPGDSDTPADLWPPLKALIKRRGGLLDVRELRVGAHPRGNAAERLRLA